MHLFVQQLVEANNIENIKELQQQHYCQTFSISPTLVGIKIVDLSDVVGASPVSVAPTASLFLT